MDFEWDSEKSAANKVKHKIDFKTARSLWEDPDRIEVVAPFPLENRFIVIGRLGAQLWAAVYTMREKTIRIISVRRARKKEAILYEKKKTCSDE